MMEFMIGWLMWAGIITFLVGKWIRENGGDRW